MTGAEYQVLAGRTINKSLSPDDTFLHGLFGLASEAGEVAGIMQKSLQGHKFDRTHITKELGDCMWFIAEIASCLNVSLDEIMEQNIDKLKERYPSGFEEEKSINRKEGDI